jgi:hypothetical protein
MSESKERLFFSTLMGYSNLHTTAQYGGEIMPLQDYRYFDVEASTQPQKPINIPTDNHPHFA